MSKGLNIGILLFDDVELLDFAGPMQVFSSARYVDESIIDSIVTISNKKSIRVSKTTMQIEIDHLINEELLLDLLIIPGGFGTRPMIKDEQFMEQVDRLVSNSQRVASVCTGSLVLAKLGYLSGLTSTTHYAAIDLLKELEPNTIIDRSKRYHDNGRFIIAEGVSAGIDMSFYLVEKLWNKEDSELTRKYIEYYPEKE